MLVFSGIECSLYYGLISIWEVQERGVQSNGVSVIGIIPQGDRECWGGVQR